VSFLLVTFLWTSKEKSPARGAEAALKPLASPQAIQPRFFADPALSNAEGLRMTKAGFKRSLE
jgi:hypothetical protein